MWFLKGDNGKFIYLRANSTMTVGRNAGDIVLPDDSSISRSHATITLESISSLTTTTEINDNTVPLSKCIIKDARAKYGNFIIKGDGVEPIKITANGYSLNNLDRIRFGLQNHIYTAHYMPIITVTSGMNDAEKKQLKEIIDAIDGIIIYSWIATCTHMSVQNPLVSEKLTCALAFGTPIVPLDYWKAALRAFQRNETFPEASDFAGSINGKLSSIGDVCVKPNPERRSIFKNLNFIHFSSKQFALYKRMIRIAGGRSIKAGRGDDLDVCHENSIVVQLVESNTTQATFTGESGYAAVCRELGKARRRTIPESEIALAILHCSTSQYCNPKYDYAALITNRKTDIGSSVNNARLLALDTQELYFSSTSPVGLVVKETLDEEDSSQPTESLVKPVSPETLLHFPSRISIKREPDDEEKVTENKKVCYESEKKLVEYPSRQKVNHQMWNRSKIGKDKNDGTTVYYYESESTSKLLLRVKIQGSSDDSRGEKLNRKHSLRIPERIKIDESPVKDVC